MYHEPLGQFIIVEIDNFHSKLLIRSSINKHEPTAAILQ